MKYKIFIFLLFFTQSVFLLKAQDFHFSQFSETPLLINPSLTGAFDGVVRSHIYFRNQWAKVINPYKTFGTSLDVHLSGSNKKKKNENGYLALGISFMNDQSGKSELTSTQGLVSIAYHLRVQKYSYLSAGLQAGFTQKKINSSYLLWDAQYDPTMPGFNSSLPNNEQYLSDGFSYTDVSAGFLYSLSTYEIANAAFDYINLKAGASIYHFTTNDDSFTVLYNNPMYPKLIFHVKSVLGLYRSKFSIIPSLMFENQGPNKELIQGAGFKYALKSKSKYAVISNESALTLGYFVRISDAFIPYIALDFAGFNLGLSYDANFSDLKKASKKIGGFEINLRYIK